MSSEKLRLRAGELYTKDEVEAALNCGDWLVDVLVSLFGLVRLGAKISHYEGSDVIAALHRHATNSVVNCGIEGPASKEQLLKRKREREKRKEKSKGVVWRR